MTGRKKIKVLGIGSVGWFWLTVAAGLGWFWYFVFTSLFSL